MMMKFPVIILLLLLDVLAEEVAQKTAMTVTCKAAPTPLGGDVEVECTFSERPLLYNHMLLYMVQQSSKVQVYNENCRHGDQKKNCSLDSKPGFQTEGVQGRTLRIVKTNLQEEDLGLYFLYSNALFDTVRFNVTTHPAMTVTCKAAPTPLGGDVEVECTFSERPLLYNHMLLYITKQNSTVQVYSESCKPGAQKKICVLDTSGFQTEGVQGRTLKIVKMKLQKEDLGLYYLHFPSLFNAVGFNITTHPGPSGPNAAIIREPEVNTNKDCNCTTPIVITALITAMVMIIMFLVWNWTRTGYWNPFHGMCGSSSHPEEGLDAAGDPLNNGEAKGQPEG